MTMFVRLALETDFDRITEMAAANVAETLPAGEPFSAVRVRELLDQYLETANPTFFVVESQRQVVAFLMATMGKFDHRDGFYTCQRVLYVAPEKRGTRAAVLLMRELIRWSQALGAVEIIGGNDNSFRSDRTAGFLGHFGFEKVGYAMARRLDE